MRRKAALIGLILAGLIVAGQMAWHYPPLNERLRPYVGMVRARLRYALAPPHEAVFQPGQADPHITATQTAAPHLLTPTPAETPTPQPSPTAQPTPTPIPAAVRLGGIRHEYQRWNNCGPATLSMALSFWGWEGNQGRVAVKLRPNPEDKNVSPYEMEQFVESETDLKAIVRMGGDVQLARRLVAAGFPVLVEIGHDGPGFSNWMGHFSLISGYDDDRQRFITQDSLISPNLSVPYVNLERTWRAFNFIYLVVYPAEREGEVFAILAEHVDEIYNNEYAARMAEREISLFEGGRDRFFALFNLGTSLAELERYGQAAAAFDEAFAFYPSVPDKHRPWRMMWYQFGPYEAYYHTGRYQDVINLANQTTSRIDVAAIEESFYWRGRSRAALGETEAAIRDQRRALRENRYFTPALQELERLGAEL